MVTDEIKFIKTSKEGVDLQYIQENYPNSIIDVNSNKERNIYIGSERVTDNYNPNVEENSITNNVGGIESGINVSELKGKSISEILDIILFSSNNNMEEYYTKLDVDNKLSDKQDILSAGSNVIIDNNEISVDLTNYAKTEDLSNYALIENLPNMEEYVSKGEIENVALKSDLNIYALKTDIPNTDGFVLKENLPNMEEYYTKLDVDKNFVSKDDLTDYAKTEDVKTELDNYYIKTDIDNKLDDKQDVLSAGSNVIIDNNEISVNLSNYALIENLPNMEEYVSKGDLSNYVKTEDLTNYALKTDIPNTDGFASKEDLSNYALVEDLPNMGEYYKKTDIDNKLDDKQDVLSAGSNVIIDNNEISVDLTNYALKTDIPNTDGFALKDDLNNYAKTEDLTNYALIENLPNMEEYVLKGEIENVALKSDLNIYALKTDIPNTDGFVLKEDLPNMEEYYTKLDVDKNFVSKDDLTDYAKTEDVKTELDNYYIKTDIDNKLDDKQDVLSAGSNVIIDNNEISVNLSNYALIENLPNMEEYYTKLDVDNNFVSKDVLTDYAKTSDIPDLTNYALKSELPEMNNYYTKDEVNNLINNIEELIGNAKLLTEEILR